MKKLYKRSTAIAVSALMMSQMIPYNVFASVNPTGPNSLTIHPYILDDTNYAQAKQDDNTPAGTADDVTADTAVASSYGTTQESNVLFTVTEVTSTGAAKQDGIKITTPSKSFSSLPDGYYKITPNNTSTDANLKEVESFFIQLPAGSNRNVHIYPKLTDNHDNGDHNTPDTEIVPGDNTTKDKHSIELTKKLSDDAEWTNSMSATFQLYSQDAMGNWVDGGTHDTDANGKVIVDGLPYGTYYMYETSAVTGYLKNSSPVKFVLDGTASSVQKADLVNDKELTVSKAIDVDGKGHTYNWTITADVPVNSENLISYSVTDTYENLKDVGVKSVFSGTTELEENTDYTVSVSGSSLTVIFVDPSSLASNADIVIKVESKLVDGFTSGSDATNTSSIAYQYAYDPDNDSRIPSQIPDDIPDLPNPTPTDDTDPDNPTVINYPADPDNPEEGTFDTVTPATITLSNVDFETGEELSDGAYDVPYCSTYTDTPAGTATTVNVVKMAPGIYEITQTGTQNGYATADPITIFVAKDGKAYLGTNANGELLTGNKVVFKNMKIADNFQLPFTGTTATIVFTIGGIAIMAGAAFFIIVLFKKKDEEEEEQNKA